MKNMKPVKNNVIVSRVEPVLTTESGIILKNPIDVDRALVESIGPDVTEVSVGEKVMIDWNKARIVEDDLYLIPVTEIVFVFE